MTGFVQEIRHARRRLARSRRFTGITLVTLALGIGATTAVFSLVRGILIEPLPYPVPAELVRIFLASQERGVDQSALSVPDFEDWRSGSTDVVRLAAHFSFTRNLTGSDNPAALHSSYVSADFFATLGSSPGLGRTFSEEDMRTAGRVVVMSDGVWRAHFGSDSSVIGTSIQLDGLAHVVVGVMPRDFRFPDPQIGLWIPLPVLLESNLVPVNRSARWLEVVGRVRPGVTLDQAREHLSRTAARTAAEYPASNEGWDHATVVPLHDSIVGDVRPALRVAMAAVGLVLLIVCGNIAMLTLARATARAGEISVRAALGASRWRLARELGAESLLLGIAGGVGGIFLATGSMSSIRRATAPLLPRIEDVGIDGNVLGFAIATTMIAMLLIGAIPAIRAARPDLHKAIWGSGRSGSSGGPSRVRWGLVAGQVALAVMLTTGAALMVKSFLSLQSVDPGFTPGGVLSARVKIPIPPDRSDLRDRITQRTDQILHELRALPGVHAVGSISALPLQDDGRVLPVSASREHVAGAADYMAQPRTVAGDYFEVMQIPLVRGDLFPSSTDAATPMSAIINQAMARRLWPGADPIGRELWMGVPYRVIGVVADVAGAGLRQEPPLTVYRHFRQQPLVDVTFVVRTDGEPGTYSSAVRAAIRGADGSQPIAAMMPLTAVVSESIARERFLTLLLSGFGILAALLAVLGLVGTLSYAVDSGKRSIAVRIAIGAHKRDILRLVVQQGMLVAGIGVAAGLLSSTAATRLLKSQLYQVRTIDVPTYAGIAVLLLVAAFLACYMPASRAARTDPMDVIR